MSSVTLLTDHQLLSRTEYLCFEYLRTTKLDDNLEATLDLHYDELHRRGIMYLEWK